MCCDKCNRLIKKGENYKTVKTLAGVVGTLLTVCVFCYNAYFAPVPIKMEDDAPRQQQVTIVEKAYQGAISSTTTAGVYLESPDDLPSPS